MQADWDRVVAEPFSLIATVAQPLWRFLEEREAVELALAVGPVASIRRNFVDVATLLSDHPSLARRS